jgi:polyisoprenoid-binding protein YceI
MTTASSNESSPAEQPFTGPAIWQLDPAGSSVSLTHKNMWGLLTVRGTFGKVSGSGEVLADGTGRGHLDIDASSLDTGNARRDEHLRSGDFFKAKEHPQITVDIASAVRQGTSTVLADGTLTVAGQSRPLSVTAQISEASDNAITLAATTEIDRADFGISWNQLGIIKGRANVNIVAKFVRPTE